MKKCPKCGKELADDALFCNGCGEKLDAGTPDTANTPAPAPAQAPAPAPAAGAPVPPPVNPGAVPPPPMMNGQAPQAPAPKNNNKMVGIIAVAVVAVIVVAIAALLLLGGGGYKAPIKNLVKAANSKSTNVTKFIDCCAPSFVSGTYNSARGLLKGGDAKEELDEAITEGFEDFYDGLEDTYGKNWRISVEFKDADKLKDDDVDDIRDTWEDFADTIENLALDDEDTWEDLADMLEDEYDTEIDPEKMANLMEKFVTQLSEVKITAAYEVKVKYTIKGKEDDMSDKMTLTVVKCNGKWIIDPLSTDIPGVGSLSSLISLASSYY